MTSGGGGLGPPEQRDPEAVARDVAEGFVTAEAAALIYRVVVDPASYAVDADATRARRSQP